MLQDLRYALRQLRKTPGFTAVALVTLALGIGVNTAIWSVLRAVLLRSLPYPSADRLVVAWQTTLDNPHFAFSYPNFEDYAAAAKSFDDIAVGQKTGMNLVADGRPERVQVAGVTSAYFRVAGIAPLFGRALSAEDDRVDPAPVAVLSHAFWRTRFAADPRVVGRTLELNGTQYAVVGVMPPEMKLPEGVDLWRPLGVLLAGEGFVERNNFPGLFALGRLRAGVSLAQAQGEAATLWKRIKTANPTSITTGIVLRPLLDSEVGGYRRGLFLLLGAVIAVLLIACANLSNLLLARGAQRAPEIAVRTALGAGRARIVRQLLFESLLLALGGGALGVAIAVAARPLLLALAPSGAARFQEVAIDLPLALLGVGLALAAGVVFGLWPAWSAARVDLRDALPGATRGGSAGPRRTRVRETLIVAEVALTLVLLVGAGLLVKSFARAAAADLGFRPDNLLLAQVAFPKNDYPTPASRAAFADRLLDRLQALPGVTSAAVNTAPPLSPGWQTLFFVEGKEYPPGQGAPLTDVATVSEGYFRAAGIALLRGRAFDATDRADGPKSVIVDERLAREYWPGQDVVGKRLEFAGGIGEATIVGLAPTLPIYGYATTPPIPQVYFLHRQVPYINTLTVLVRTAGEPEALRAPLARLVTELDPKQPAYNVRTMRQDIARTQAAARLYSTLLGCFSLLALVLAAVGLYGVIAYSVGQRTREIGIRMALGALRRQVFGGVLRDGLRLFAVGAAIGLAAALAVSRLAASLLYGVTTTDVGVYASVLLLLGAVVLVASGLPARRASAVQPIEALRSE